MTLKQWQSNGWLRAHETSAEEIGNLLAIVKRDLQDAGETAISADWRFGIAYNAALKLCTVLIYAEGFRPEKTLAHYRTFQALPLVWGARKKPDAEYLDTCRTKRNTLEYDYVGGATEDDADELIDFVRGFEKEVLKWLKEKHPELL
jgi:hypothetical protein